jgi:ACS family hexuronate transporter-like MFS transporter
MKIRNLRWWIITMVALAIAINYLDRQNLPVAINELRKTIPISDMQYGLINSLFLLAYGTMYAVGGRLLDILGTRIGYAVMIIWWSIANLLHGLVTGVLGLGIVRFLLGTGEGGSFPASAKVISEWFPAKERSFAFGIFNTGSSLGAVIAVPLIAFIIGVFNWRSAFIFCGLLGLVWGIGWFGLFQTPAKSRFITPEEKDYIDKADEGATATGPVKIPWKSLFQYRNMWGLMLIKFLTDAAWFFFIFWLPKYLNDVRGLDIQAIGASAWIPYAFAGAGSFVGGWLSSHLIKKGRSLDFSRKIILGFSAALLPLSLLIKGSSLEMAIVFFGMAMFGHQSWSTIVQTLATDLFPSEIVGSVSGLMGCVGTYGAMIFSFVIGYVIGQFGYDSAFLIAGILHPVSFVLVLVIIKRIGPAKHSVQSKSVIYLNLSK